MTSVARRPCTRMRAATRGTRSRNRIRLQCALGAVHVAFAQANIDEVAGLGQRGDDGVVDAGVVMLVVLAARLLAVHVDGQPVHVDGGVA